MVIDRTNKAKKEKLCNCTQLFDLFLGAVCTQLMEWMSVHGTVIFMAEGIV